MVAIMLLSCVVALMSVHLCVLGPSDALLLFRLVCRCLIRGRLLSMGWQTKVKFARIDLFVGMEATQVQERPPMKLSRSSGDYLACVQGCSILALMVASLLRLFTLLAFGLASLLSRRCRLWPLI